MSIRAPTLLSNTDYHPNQVAFPSTTGPTQVDSQILDISRQGRQRVRSCSSAEAQNNVAHEARGPRGARDRQPHMDPSDISEISNRQLDLELNSPSASSPASSAFSLSTSAPPTTSTRSPTPDDRPPHRGVSSRTATPSSPPKLTPTTGTRIPKPGRDYQSSLTSWSP